jgi:hypothetical protein
MLQARAMMAGRLGWAAQEPARAADAPARAGDLPRWLACGAMALAALGAAAWFAAPFLGSADGWPDLAVYADDLFYYLEIAARVLAGEGFTFDGATRTNGFHPLWMAALLAIGTIAPPRSAGFFVLLQLVLLTATLATALGCYRMLRETFSYAGGAALTGTALAATQALLLARSGMETTFALPLIFVAVIALGRLLAAPCAARAAAASLLAALAILARLDAAILFALLGVAALLGAWRDGRIAGLLAPRVLAGLALGALPLVAYLGLNLALFGALQPVSGRAKQLADGLFFNPIAPILFAWGLYQLANLQLTPVVALTALPVLLGLHMLALSLVRRTVPARCAGVAWTLVGFPVAYYAVLGVISTWEIWGWYLYPVVPATAVAAAGIMHAMAGERSARRDWTLVVPIAAALAGFALVIVQAPQRSVQGSAIIATGRALAGFAAAHPGRYAMGDRAGAFAFLSDQPVVQLEGLVGDAALLESIRARRPLLDALAARGVDYYVGTSMPREAGCWRGQEPHVSQAGLRAPRMEGLLCRPPVFVLVGGDGVEALVFDLRRADAPVR